MTEWGVFGVLAELIFLGVSIGVPLIRLNSNLTRLNVVLEQLQKQFEDEKKANEREHKDLWDKCDQQDDELANHEIRLTVLEKMP